MALRVGFIERVLHRLHVLPTPVLDAFASVLFGRALAIAVRRGLFDALARGPLTGEEIVAATRIHPHAVHLLLESCVVGGYLTRRQDAYGLSAEGRKWLCSDSPHSLVHLIAYFETLYFRWADLEASLDRGAPLHPYYEMFEEHDWQTYVLGMRDLARLLLPRVIGRIMPEPGARSLLDIGGSHGLYAIECCRRSPALHATIMDFAPALRHASALMDEPGIAGRVNMLEGNFLLDPLPGEQDEILMFNIIHGLTELENRGLIDRALGALRPGGRLFILDQIREERASTPLAQFIPLMVGLNLLNEIGGTVYRLEDVKEWCAGHAVRRLKLGLPGVALLSIRRS